MKRCMYSSTVETGGGRVARLAHCARHGEVFALPSSRLGLRRGKGGERSCIETLGCVCGTERLARVLYGDGKRGGWSCCIVLYPYSIDCRIKCWFDGRPPLPTLRDSGHSSDRLGKAWTASWRRSLFTQARLYIKTCEVIGACVPQRPSGVVGISDPGH